MSFFLPILFIGSVQAFFSALMIASKKSSGAEKVFMSILLLIISIEFVIYILDIYGIIKYHFPVLQFTIGPLIYLFIKAIKSKNYTLNIADLLHFIPFTVFLFVWIFFVYNLASIKYSDKINSYSNSTITFLMGIALFITLLTYLILSLKEIYSYQKNLKSVFSYHSFKNSLNWIKVIVVLMVIGYTLMFTYSSLLLFKIINIAFNPLGIITISFTILSYLIGFYGYNQPALFNQKFNHTNTQHQPTEEKNTYKLNKKETDQITKKIEEIMMEQKPYTKGDLTIDELASILNISRSGLTQLLNQNMGKNFYKFINEYRVNEAKNLLVDPEFKNFSLVAIGYEAGFNSKSTFNSFFKSQTGMTPSEFKKRYSPKK